jgi:mannose-1-phosphate guanylyltransferase/mannose-6-phosphate isomerase
MDNNYAIILCGGSGTRLWPLSRSLKPKQFLSFTGEKTLYQETVERIAQKISLSHILTVTNHEHIFEVKGQLAEKYSKAIDGVIAEPLSRNTLPAIAIAVKRIFQVNPQALISVFPSDHFIKESSAFIQAWNYAERAATEGYLTLFGIKPDHPATGYGYIFPNPSQDLSNLSGYLTVDAFFEKPNKALAEQYINQGCLWNSGMFVFHAQVFMDLLLEYQPEIYSKIIEMSDPPTRTDYEDLESLSIDFGLTERVRKIAVVPVDMGWSDLGNWESIYQYQDKDKDNNCMRGEIVSVDSQDNLLWSDSGVISVLGVHHLAVIQSADVTMVCDRSKVEDVKTLVSKMQDKYPKLVETHLTVQRPWGSYTVLEERPHFKIKSILVKPHQRLSLQKHQFRSEHWIVVSGIASVTNENASFKVKANESTYIPANNKHRLANETEHDLIVIEVQTGTSVDESDIVRFEDIYGRDVSE